MLERIKLAWNVLRHGHAYRFVDVDCFNLLKPPHVNGVPAASAKVDGEDHYLFVLDEKQPSVQLKFARERTIEISIRL